MSKKEVISAFEDIVGSENVSTDIFDCIVHSVDGAKVFTIVERLDKSKIPIAVVQATNAKEVAEILKLANKEKVPVIIRTTGTSQILAIPPQVPGSIILDLSKMWWINLFEEAGYVEVGPAVILDDLNEFLAPYGYEFPIFPGSHRISSWGGCISINTSGHVVDAYQGKPGDYVLGLEVVLPTGEIIQTGTKSLRKHAGPDLTRLFIGGEGHFGVITRIRLRLLPKPIEKKWAWVIFDTLETLVRAVMRLYHERAPYPRILEFMDEKLTELSFKKLGIPIPKGVLMMLTTDGEAPGEAQWKLERILEICKKDGGLKEARILKSEAEWNDIWAAREIPRDIMRGGFRANTLDPPLSELPNFLKEVKRIQEKYSFLYGVESYLFGHIGGPSMHWQLNCPPDWDEEMMKKVNREIDEDILELRLKYDVSAGENGIFPLRKEWFKKAYGETYINLIKGIKRVFDPNNILSPGRI